MNRFEAKYHAYVLITELIDDFVETAKINHKALDLDAFKIMKEVVKIQKKNQLHANKLSRGFARFSLVDTLRRQ